MFVQLFFERYQCFSFLVAEFLLAAGFVFVLSIKLTIHADQLEIGDVIRVRIADTLEYDLIGVPHE